MQLESEGGKENAGFVLVKRIATQSAWLIRNDAIFRRLIFFLAEIEINHDQTESSDNQQQRNGIYHR
ncbi:MAG: hypothetical protein QNK24_15465, partial [Desulfuromusa sp.]|nr:hypothetical protein [Desulfuromusa sp.]